MSISFKEGSLFDYQFDALVNPVNCVGVMGAGLALQFKWRFPKNFDKYKERCLEHRMQPGRMFVHFTGMACPRFIVNFPTKLHWRDPSKLRYIVSGLKDLVQQIQKLGISSIAVPPLGCGLGGLKWSDVSPVIVDALCSVENLDATLFVPRNTLQDGNSPSIIQ